MLKHHHLSNHLHLHHAAAFGRLCVETPFSIFTVLVELAAAFGRLCVETLGNKQRRYANDAAAFGRLCVETFKIRAQPSTPTMQPPSGGCVLKQLGSLPVCLYAPQPPSGGCVLKPYKLQKNRS